MFGNFHYATLQCRILLTLLKMLFPFRLIALYNFPIRNSVISLRNNPIMHFDVTVSYICFIIFYTTLLLYVYICVYVVKFFYVIKLVKSKTVCNIPCGSYFCKCLTTLHGAHFSSKHI